MIKMIKLPLDTRPLHYIRDRLQLVNRRESVVILPTNRNLRTLASYGKWELDIQTVAEFTRRANLYPRKLLPKELRDYFMYRSFKLLSIGKQAAVWKTKSPGLVNYISFMQRSSAILPFFRELCVEGVSAKELKIGSMYQDYEEQVNILVELWSVYCTEVESAGYIDEWAYFRDPTIDNDYISRYNLFVFVISGYLSKYEIIQLKNLSEVGDVEVYFNYTDAAKSFDTYSDEKSVYVDDNYDPEIDGELTADLGKRSLDDSTHRSDTRDANIRSSDCVDEQNYNQGGVRWQDSVSDLFQSQATRLPHAQAAFFLEELGCTIEVSDGDQAPDWRAVNSLSDLSNQPKSTISIVYHDNKIFNEAISTSGAVSLKVAEILPASSMLAQYDLITERILKLHFVEGVPLSKIAVILPSDRMAPYFVFSDRYRLYNVSSGISGHQFEFYRQLELLLELLVSVQSGAVELKALEKFASSFWFESIVTQDSSTSAGYGADQYNSKQYGDTLKWDTAEGDTAESNGANDSDLRYINDFINSAEKSNEGVLVGGYSNVADKNEDVVTSHNEKTSSADSRSTDNGRLDDNYLSKNSLEGKYYKLIQKYRSGGDLFIDIDLMARMHEWRGIYAVISPFLPEYMSYTQIISKTISLLQKAMKWAEGGVESASEYSDTSDTLNKEREIEGISAAISELEKLKFVYSHISEEFPTLELLGSIVGSLSAILVPVDKGSVTVIGLLESRNMHYDYLFIPDLNDDVFPADQGKDLFINSELRCSLKLPTFADRQELQKGYVYQIVARAKRSLLTYTRGEDTLPSTVINELLAKSKAKVLGEEAINVFTPKYLYNFPATKRWIKDASVEIAKDDKIIKYLNDFRYSATSLACYRRCPTQFFYRYIKKLYQEDQFIDDNDLRVLGTVMHRVIEKLFNDRIYADNPIYLDSMKEYFNIYISKYHYFTHNAVGRFQASALKHRFDQLATQERQRLRNGAQIQGMEQELGGEMFGISVTGRVDRWDKTPQGYAIIDYKYKRLEEVANVRDFDKVDLQLPLYALIMQDKYGSPPSEVLWFDLKGGQGFIQGFPIHRLDEFNEYLKDLVGKVLSPGEFGGTADAANCAYCTYSSFCQKSLE